MVRRHGTVCLVILAACALVATAGGPPPPAAYPAGPTRGGLNVVLPYYPASPRAAGMGLATVAVGGVDSHNPAALGFAKKIDIVADYGRMSFDHGPDLDIGHTAIVVPTPKLGGFTKIMMMGIRTRHDDPSRLPGSAGGTYIWGRQFGIASGVEVPLPDKIPGRLALGFAGFPYDPSEVRLKAGGLRTAQGRGQSQIGSIRLGTIYQPIEQVSVGAEFTHIKDYVRNKVLIVPPTTYLRQNSNYYVNLWTVGVSVQPDDKTTIGIQHVFGRAQGQGIRANYDIFSAGIERRVPVNEEIGLALRTGINDGSPTFGLGVNLPHGLRVDYALLVHYGEQVKSAFGHGDLHIIGVGKSF
ncbi:hypothetical protein ACFL09_00385 [Planctomycetota bacterium]